MHTFLYCVLAWLGSSLLSKKHRPAPAIAVLIPVFAIALLQESIQFLCEGMPIGRDEIFDIIVDLNGALLGVAMFRWTWYRAIMQEERGDQSDQPDQ